MKSTSPFVSLQFRDFRLLLIAVFISQLGVQMQLVAINWHIYELTHSPIYLGFLGLAGFLPIILFSLIGGVLADHVDRKKLFSYSQLIVGMCAIILFLSTITHHISPWIIYGITIVNALVSAINIPAKQSLIPSLIPQPYLRQGISMHSIIWQTAIVAGPTIGGVLIGLYGVQSVYLFNALVSLIAVYAIIQISFISHVTEKISFDIRSNIQKIVEGLHFVKSTPLIYATMILDFFATFFASASVLMPVFALDILHVGPQGVGLLYSAPAVGGIIAGFMLSSIHTLHKQGRILLSGIILYGVATIGFGLSKIFFLSLVFLLLSGAGDMVSAVIRNTIRQSLTPDNLRGRMVSINMNFFLGGPYLGDIEAGVLAAVIGTPLSVVVGGVATIITSVIIGYLIPKVRNYTSEESLV